MKPLLLSLLTLLPAPVLFAQSTIAIPGIISYTKQDYNAGSQNWKIVQDDRGIIYVANNEGLLTFDGNHWNKYLLPNETIVRSAALGDDSKIYVGGQGEIGYFLPDRNGLLGYHSLSSLIPHDQREFADIWNVVVLKNAVFFRSNKRIFQYENERIIAYPSPNWDFMGYANGMIMANEYEKGLLRYRNGLWQPLAQSGDIPKNAKLIDFVALTNDSSLIITKTSGFFSYSKGVIKPFLSPDLAGITDKIVNGVIKINDEQLAVATALAGCFIINHKGELLQRLSRHEGLQNNNIIAISLDKRGNIWLGLDNGIDFIAYNSPIRHIYADNQEHSSAYAAIIHKNDLYLGLASGLYRAPITPGSDLSYARSAFTQVNNSRGQVWNLSEVNQQLIMGHNDGAFIVEGDNAITLDSSSGFWLFQPLSPVQPSRYMLAGTYNGINIYDFRNGRFIDSGRHTHFESSRFVALDNNIAWVAHPYMGLYRVDFSKFPKPTYVAYSDTQRILSKNRNYLYKLKNRIILANDIGLFEYNTEKDDFVPCAFLRQIFKNETVQYLREDEHGNVWFIQNKHLGVVDFSGSQPEVVFIPEIDSKLLTSGFDFIYPYDLRNIFVAGEHGFFVLNYEKYRTMTEKTPLILTSVKASGEYERNMFGGFTQMQGDGATGFINRDAAQLPYEWNTLNFAFSSPLYGKQASTEYAVMLENFDKGWSPWSTKTEKEYTYLPPGNYVFKVKARSSPSDTPTVLNYSFSVLPPWYKTKWAWLAYTSAAVFLVAMLYRRQRKKFEAQQRRHEEESKQLQYLHQLEIEKSEAEIVRLKNEKLEAELQLKNKELATTTINLVQRSEVLHRIKDEVLRIKKSGSEHENPEDFKKIIRMLEPEKVKKDWEQFALHFNQVHDEFLVALKKKYPRLTPNEIKLCAYLRLNISSKEIAHIMNITIKSVELSRYRLRKKLELPPDVNLFNFLLEFHSQYKKDAVA